MVVHLNKGLDTIKKFDICSSYSKSKFIYTVGCDVMPFPQIVVCLYAMACMYLTVILTFACTVSGLSFSFLLFAFF